MPRSEAREYLSIDPSPSHAYDRPNLRHFYLKYSLETMLSLKPGILANATLDYATTGVAYFAHRGHDDYMAAVGKTTWDAIEANRLLIFLHMNEAALIESTGIEPAPPSPMPSIYFSARQSEDGDDKMVALILMPDFLLAARTRPIIALAALVTTLSVARDFELGNLQIDPVATQRRASATLAHFLLEARRQESSFVIGPEFQHLLIQYPQGILSLPPELR